MNNRNNINDDDDLDRKPAAQEQPSFRFATIQAPQRPTMASAPAKDSSSNIIDPRQYASRSSTAAAAGLPPLAQSQWSPTTLPAVPAFYPLEKSSRLVPDISGTEMAARICRILKLLSVQAIYDNDAATAQLLTGDHVEMHLSLWTTTSTSNDNTMGVLVEVQRRKGDPILFYQYCRQILDAAAGEHIPQDALAARYSKRVQRLLHHTNNSAEDPENAIVAMEIAHGLVLKDRMDTRVLGLESLCLLTDPTKTGSVTAILTSHVVLLGTLQGIELLECDTAANTKTNELLQDSHIYEEIRAAILGLVQFSRIGLDGEADAEQNQGDAEHLTILHNLALAVLANALAVIENEDTTNNNGDDTTTNYDESEHYNIHDDEAIDELVEQKDVKPRGRLRTASSNDVTNEFLKATEESCNREILSTLIRELSQAGTKPHDACLSAKCLGTICRASQEARKRAKELGAKTVVATALDVGQQTHSKLETECEAVQQVLRLTESNTSTTNNSNVQE